MANVYVWDADYVEGDDWAMRCDSIEAANELLRRVRDENKGSYDVAKIVELDYFPTQYVEKIKKLPLITLQRLNKEKCVEEMIGNIGLRYDSEDGEENEDWLMEELC